MTTTMLRRAAILIALLAVLAVPARAAEETLTGKIMCAMCTLKKADAKECQDVLVVTDANGAVTEYYVEKNAVAEKAGDVCTGEVPATITGTVSEKDGKKWITPSKIEPSEKK